MIRAAILTACFALACDDVACRDTIAALTDNVKAPTVLRCHPDAVLDVEVVGERVIGRCVCPKGSPE